MAYDDCRIKPQASPLSPTKPMARAISFSSLGAGDHLTTDMLQPALFEGLRCFHIMGSTLSMSDAVFAVCREALQMAAHEGSTDQLRS